jgi:hexosaminidase
MLIRLTAFLACICFLAASPIGSSIVVNHALSSSAPNSTLDTLIPRPVSVVPAEGEFTLSETTTIYVDADADELSQIGQFFADLLKNSTGYNLPVQTGEPSTGNIYFTIANGDPALGDEGYQLTITPDQITLSAYQPAGIFWGVQTLRQLLPPAVEQSTVQPGPWTIPAAEIKDYPRFAWRGAMLDVARHFFSVDDVKRYIDLLAYYKMNRLHLHLADDQGWRIMINAWPNLTTYGGSTEVGGGEGGYYTQEDYAEIVAYAQARYIIIVPEIDMPGHTNAALASYSELNCDDKAPDLYTGTRVGFSSLCIDKDITYTFVDDVVRELAAITPGPYLHIGGDEASATEQADYIQFLERVETIVQSYDKQMVGWEEIARSELLESSIAQHWFSNLASDAVRQGAKVIMSPASKAYLDMKYNEETELGLDWAGLIEVSTAYNWDPATVMYGVEESDILGVEAPLWSETLETIDDIEYMAFPRLCGYAEIGWSPTEGRTWDEYKIRLAAHSPRLEALGVNYYPSTEVPW